ncbi:NAD(P)/FAD-dependent oxidoreductase [Lichenibacterium ramalinae]|uniref:FAD-binding oxidoreductase n=1 Tax=Lichenibacterium ramalinae TaxID=2316527 RepID=A0A4Q2RCI3_9HYPH|nr:FAD-binding oxidoreductase [Lichenibacterium ramalinae]RYB05221.1 FAD-binding oxidoreductase [Lichenibacterium ramalinae]
MSARSFSPRTVVVGGGIFGVSTALHLARSGAEVTLVTEAEPGSGASGRSLSWLNSSRTRSAEYHALRMAGIDRYRTLAARHPDADWLRFDGGLTWDADDAGNGIAEAYAYERRIAYDARLLQPEAVAAVTPGVDRRAITSPGAIFNPGEGWVDLPSLIDLLSREYLALGGRLATGVGPCRVDVAGGRATGVTTQGGERFPADVVLLATGPAVPAMVAELGTHIPDATPISLLVQTEPISHPLRAVLNTPRVAIRRTPTGALVLDSAWSEEEVSMRPDGSYEVRDSTVAGLLREASAVLEGSPRLLLASCGVGPKPIPRDGEPVFGPLDGVPGCYVAFSHSGATLGLIAGELLAEEMTSRALHPMLARFRPGRFASAPHG